MAKQSQNKVKTKSKQSQNKENVNDSRGFIVPILLAFIDQSCSVKKTGY